MTDDEAAKFKQQYWSIEAKYGRWPVNLSISDKGCDDELMTLFKSIGIADKNLDRFRNFMMLSYDYKPAFIAEMIEVCRRKDL